MDSTTAPRYTGMDLKLKRVAEDIGTGELADAMGVTDSRISYIEGRRLVTVKAASRYLDALATLTTKRTEGAA